MFNSASCHARCLHTSRLRGSSYTTTPPQLKHLCWLSYTYFFTDIHSIESFPRQLDTVFDSDRRPTTTPQPSVLSYSLINPLSPTWSCFRCHQSVYLVLPSVLTMKLSGALLDMPSASPSHMFNKNVLVKPQPYSTICTGCPLA